MPLLGRSRPSRYKIGTITPRQPQPDCGCRHPNMSDHLNSPTWLFGVDVDQSPDVKACAFTKLGTSRGAGGSLSRLPPRSSRARKQQPAQRCPDGEVAEVG